MLAPITHPSPVILSYGLGVDSSALLFRWLADPSSRDFDVAALTVLTAMTGDEFEDTRGLVEAHVLPRLRAAGVRYVQVARRGPARGDGVVVLDDSAAPARLHLEGAYPLSAEMLAGGTLPESAHGKRKCSQKAKGVPLDQTIAALLGGTFKGGRVAGARPFRHVIGFNADEGRRVARDQCYGGGGRLAEYPLVAWGWGREKVEAYCREAAGETWAKSCCSFCPFSKGKEGIAERFRLFPDKLADVLIMEALALALNPRMPLYADRSAHAVLAEARGLERGWALYRERLASCPWALYRVRRCRAGKAWHRCVAKLHEGTRGQAEEMLASAAGRAGAEVETAETGLARAWLRRRPAGKDAGATVAEEMLAAAPALARDKARPHFASHWSKAIAVVEAPVTN